MTALPHRPNGTRAGARARRAGIAVLLAAFAAGALVGAARADEPVKGAVTASTDGGYARLVFKFDEQVAAKIRLNWPILVISFQKPVKVAVDRLRAGAPGYISAARIDPDGGAIRIALARKLTINTTPAAERLYVDLLPEKWSGVMPGLPKEVVEHLAERAREAERLLQRQRAEQKRREVPLIHVKVGERAHLHPLHVRPAGRRQRRVGARRGEIHAHLRPRHQMGPGRRAGGDAIDA